MIERQDQLPDIEITLLRHDGDLDKGDFGSVLQVEETELDDGVWAGRKKWKSEKEKSGITRKFQV